MTNVSIVQTAHPVGIRPFLLTWRTGTVVSSESAQGVADALGAVCDAVNQGGLADADGAVETYRAVVQALGRNPNRYRISSDALRRRCVKEGGIRSILPLVDLNNLVSLRTGWPVGCYDQAALVGDVSLRLGTAGETMSTIGKGDFDIERLPVLVDDDGPFGSTVSDSIRAAVTDQTSEALFVLYGYGACDHAGLIRVALEACALAGLVPASGPTLIGGRSS